MSGARASTSAGQTGADQHQERATWLTFRDGSRMPVSWRDDPEREGAFQAKLTRFHDVLPRPTCDCRTSDRELEVAIRRLPSGRHILACLPLEGPLHRRGCAFYRPDPERSGMAG